MKFREYFNSLTVAQQAEVRKQLKGNVPHLISGKRMAGHSTYMKLKQIDPSVTWEKLRGLE